MARFDWLRALCQLATQFTKLDAYGDNRLHRIMCYIKSTVNLKMVGWVGDDAENITPVLYADADFASCIRTSRSTSGVALFMVGNYTKAALSAVSKRQTAVSHSTPEAELVAADAAGTNAGSIINC